MAMDEADFIITNNSIEEGASLSAAPALFEQPYAFVQTVAATKDIVGGLSTAVELNYMRGSKPQEVSIEQSARLPEPNVLVVFVIGLIGLILSRRNARSHHRE